MRTKKIKKATLKQLYITEEKSLATIAQMLSCSPPTVRSRCVEQGIKIREAKSGKSIKNCFSRREATRKA